jgi:crossover junction endodeoxyribonuclease RusA
MKRLLLPFPPSVNTYWRHLSKGPLAGRTLLSEDGRKYRKAVEQAVVLQRAGSVGEARLRIDIECRMPDRRRRDVDNVPKAVLDALTHAGFWSDDSQIDDMRVWRSELMEGIVVVSVEVLPAVQPSLLEAA